MFIELNAKRNYILLADTAWHLLLLGKKIFKLWSKKVSEAKS